MFKFFRRHKAITFGIFLTLFMIFTAYICSLSAVSGFGQSIAAISNAFDRHKMLVLLWHILIAVAIYVGWGIKVDRAALRSNLPEDQVKRVKRLRWLMIGGMCLIDVFYFL